MLAKHGAIYLVSKILPAVFSLALLAVFTRLLTPAQYGSYSLTILVAGLANAVCLRWINLGVGRYLPDCQNKIEQQQLLGTARFVTLLISIILVFLFLVVHGFRESIGFSVIFYMVGLMAASQAWYDLNLKVQNANLNPVNYGLTLGVKSSVALVLGCIVVYLGFGAEGASITLVIALYIASLLSINLWRAVPLTYVDKNQLAKLWDYGAPLTITFLLIFIIDASDRLFIDKMLGAQSLGVYSAAYEFILYSIGSFIAVVQLTTFPLVNNAFANHGATGAREQLKKSFVFLFAIIMPITFGLIAVSSNIADVIMGGEFSEQAALIIPWIAVGMFFSSFKSAYFDYAFQLASSTRVQTLTVAIAAVANLILNYLLIPVYGVLGAAAATVISFLIAVVTSMILGRYVFKMPTLPLAEPLKIVFAAFFMVFIIGFIKVSNQTIELILQVSAGAIIYLGIIILANVMNVRNFILRNCLHRKNN